MDQGFLDVGPNIGVESMTVEEGFHMSRHNPNPNPDGPYIVLLNGSSGSNLSQYLLKRRDFSWEDPCLIRTLNCCINLIQGDPGRFESQLPTQHPKDHRRQPMGPTKVSHLRTGHRGVSKGEREGTWKRSAPKGSRKRVHTKSNANGVPSKQNQQPLCFYLCHLHDTIPVPPLCDFTVVCGTRFIPDSSPSSEHEKTSHKRQTQLTLYSRFIPVCFDISDCFWSKVSQDPRLDSFKFKSDVGHSCHPPNVRPITLLIQRQKIFSEINILTSI